MELKLIEVLQDSRLDASPKSIRVTFRFKGLLIVVKVFDPDGDDNYSIKYYHKAESYLRVRSFWNSTTRIITPQRKLMWTGKARRYFWSIYRKLTE